MKPKQNVGGNIDNDILQNVDLPDYKVVTLNIATRWQMYMRCPWRPLLTAQLVKCFRENSGSFVLAAGYHNVYNALTAIAVSHLWVSIWRIQQGIANYNPAGMRQKVVKKDGITCIIDCYNPSPRHVPAPDRSSRNAGRT